MSTMIREIRQLLQGFLAPEMREIKARLDALESKVDAYEERAEKRHDQVLLGLRQITDYTSVIERLFPPGSPTGNQALDTSVSSPVKSSAH